MATLAPDCKCMICGERPSYVVAEVYRPVGSPIIFGPTHWEQEPHSCPPEAVEKWLSKIFPKINTEFMETTG